jgi:integrase
MDDIPVTELADTHSKSPEQSPAWQIPDGTQSSVDILAMPEGLNELPEWIRLQLRRFLRLKQRNWPAKNLRQRTWNLFNRLNHMICFFNQHDEWNEWQQLAVRDLTCFYLLWHCGLRIIEVCSLLVKDVDLESGKLFIRNRKARKDRMVYISDNVSMVLQQHLAIRHTPLSGYVFASRSGAITTRCLQRRLKSYGQQCGVPVNARRLRHTFASQMLAASMPVTSLQRYMGHEHLDTTMIYAEVSDPMLQQDYYQGITALDPSSGKLPMSGLELPQQRKLRQLVEELRTPGLDQSRHDEILDIILAHIR